jgi:hypothetical protein
MLPDARFTVSQLTDAVAASTGESRRDVLQVIPLVCYVFGQTGHLGSATQAQHALMERPAPVAIPAYHRRLIRRLLRRAGVFPRS